MNTNIVESAETTQECNKIKKFNKKKLTVILSIVFLVLLLVCTGSVILYNTYTEQIKLDGYKQEVDTLIKDINSSLYSVAAEEVSNLSDECFSIHEKEIITTFGDCMKNNTYVKPTYGVGDIDDYIWKTKKELLTAIQKRTTNSLENYENYIDVVLELYEFKKYNEYIEFFNSTEYSSFETAVLACPVETSTGLLQAKSLIEEKIDTFEKLNNNYSYGLKKFFDAYYNYYDAIIDLYNGYYAKNDINLVKSGTEKAIDALDDITDIGNEIAKIQSEISETYKRLPEIN